MRLKLVFINEKTKLGEVKSLTKITWKSLSRDSNPAFPNFSAQLQRLEMTLDTIKENGTKLWGCFKRLILL